MGQFLLSATCCPATIDKGGCLPWPCCASSIGPQSRPPSCASLCSTGPRERDFLRIAFGSFLQRRHKAMPFLVVFEDRLRPVTSVRDATNRGGMFNSQFSRHDGTSGAPLEASQSWELTPYPLPIQPSDPCSNVSPPWFTPWRRLCLMSGRCRFGPSEVAWRRNAFN